MRRLLCFAVIAVALGAVGRASAQEKSRIVSVDIQGKLIDPKDRLARFLGLVPGVEIDTSAQDRLFKDLDALGYRVVDLEFPQVDGGIAVKLHVEPQRVV